MSAIVTPFCLSADPKATQKKLTVLLDWKPNTNHTGFFVAKNKGFYANEGIDISIINPSQTSVSMLVGRGKAEFGISYATNLINAREAGIPIVGIAAIVQPDTSCFVWRKTTGIKNIKDFEGKRYASLGGEEELVKLKYIMDKNGADFSKLKIVTTGVTDFLQTTERNADIMWEYKAWGMLSAEEQGIKIGSYCLSEEFKQLAKPSPLLITNDRFLKENKELVQKFLRATEKGFEYAIKNPTEAAKILVKENPGLDEKFVIKSQKFLSPLYKENAPYWGYITPKQFESYADWMVETKLLKQKPKLENFIIDLYKK